ncbi:hypothetical protein D3C87_1815660 [compost metagenome]
MRRPVSSSRSLRPLIDMSTRLVRVSAARLIWPAVSASRSAILPVVERMRASSVSPLRSMMPASAAWRSSSDISSMLALVARLVAIDMDWSDSMPSS